MTTFQKRKLEMELHGKITFLTPLNAWGHLLSDVNIYDVPRVLTFIFDRVSIGKPFYNCVIKTDF